MGETIDALAIAAILVMTGILGFAQEWRAERTLESLRAMLSVYRLRLFSNPWLLVAFTGTLLAQIAAVY